MGREREKVKTSLLRPWQIFFWEGFLFSLTLGLGITTAFKLNQLLMVEKITPPPISSLKFILTFFLATLFTFFLIRFLKFRKEKGIILKIIFILTIGWASLIFLETWLSEPFPFIIVSALIFWWWKKPLVLNQDILIILGLAGGGSALGLVLQPLTVVVLLIIFSIYDYIAVYKTKHMIEMAKEMLEQKAILALVIPPQPSGFGISLAEIKPGEKILILGGGDIVFPLLFSVSLISTGTLNPIVVAFFSLIGLFVSFYFFTKQKIYRPMPALPPIAFFSIIGYLMILAI